MWIRLYRNNRARYSRKTEAKTGMLPRKETKILETQVSLESPDMLGNSDLSRKHVFSANSTRPVGQVLLEIHSSEIREYSSQTGGRAEVFCPESSITTHRVGKKTSPQEIQHGVSESSKFLTVLHKVS